MPPKVPTILLLLFLTAATAFAEKPNILFILADDLGYGDLGCYGAEDIETPHLDQLAKDGLRFTDFYANGAVCSPTRAAFLTGRYQQRLGLDNALTYQEMGRGLEIGGKTIATMLKGAGYTTGLSGKWHLGYDDGRRPQQQGFDHFFGLLGGNHHYFQHMDRIGVHDLWEGDEPVRREGYSTDLMTADALSFIEESHEQPFFLYLSHPAPHFPWQGPEDEDKDVQPKKKSWQTGDRETYIAMVESMDQGIGKVLAKLDELGLRDNTLVVFGSDNGGHTYSRNAPLRDEKGTVFEGGVRVPCIMRWPEKLPAGETTSQVGITMDLTATFRDVAGLEPAEKAEGTSLLPFLEQDETTDRTLYWRRQDGPRRKVKEKAGRAMREGKWKLVELGTGEHYLFNLEADISESNNLLSQHPEMAEEMSQKLDAWEADVDADAPKL